MVRFSDEQIIEAVILGNVDTYNEIVLRYQNNIYSIGKRFFKNDEDAKDFAQDVFIKAYSKLPQFKGRSSFKYWLIKIAYNYGITRIKHRVEESNIIEDTISDAISGPEDRHITNELKYVISEAMGKLPLKYKLCVDLYFFVGLSYKEISTITEFPINTIKSHVSRAKQQLRNYLKGSIAEDFYDK